MMNPFYPHAAPTGEKERKVARAIAWSSLLVWTVVLLLAALLPP